MSKLKRDKIKKNDINSFDAELNESVSFDLNHLQDGKRFSVVIGDSVYIVERLFDRIIIKRSWFEDVSLGSILRGDEN